MMNLLILLTATVLSVLLVFGLRTMQAEHLFAIGHRAEFCGWAMFTLYLGSIVLFDAQPLVVFYDPSTAAPVGTLLLAQLILLAIMISRILAVAAFTLGNPPKVRVELHPDAQKTKHVTLAPITDTPGVELEADGSGRVLL